MYAILPFIYTDPDYLINSPKIACNKLDFPNKNLLLNRIYIINI